jgi:hypothetical protein
MNKRHTPEQIIRKLRQAEAELAADASVPEVTRRLGPLHRAGISVGGPEALDGGLCSAISLF